MWSPARTTIVSASERSMTFMFRSTASAVPRYHSATRPRAMYGWSSFTPPVSRSGAPGRPPPARLPGGVPRPPEADVVVEGVRVVLGQHEDVVDVRVDAVRQREVDDPVLAAEGDCRFGAHSG